MEDEDEDEEWKGRKERSGEVQSLCLPMTQSAFERCQVSKGIHTWLRTLAVLFLSPNCNGASAGTSPFYPVYT